MNLRTFILTLSVLTGFFCTCAQPKQGIARLDSLIAEVPYIHDDSAGVRVLDAISFGYLNIDPEEAIKWANKEFHLAQKIGWQKGEAFAYCNMGEYYNNRGNYDKALEVVTKARKIFHEIGNKQKEAETSVPIGNIYLYKKKYQIALEYYSNSLNYAKSIYDKEWQQIALSNIGNVYASWAKSEMALGYMQQAMELAISRNDIAGIMLLNANIGTIYTDKKEFPAAIAYQFKALQLAEKLGEKQSAAIYRGNIGCNYFCLAKFNNYKADSLVSSNRSVNLNKGIAFLKLGIADCRKLQYKRGIEMFTRVLDEANSLKKTIEKK